MNKSTDSHSLWRWKTLTADQVSQKSCMQIFHSKLNDYYLVRAAVPLVKSSVVCLLSIIPFIDFIYNHALHTGHFELVLNPPFREKQHQMYSIVEYRPTLTSYGNLSVVLMHFCSPFEIRTYRSPVSTLQILTWQLVRNTITKEIFLFCILMF